MASDQETQVHVLPFVLALVWTWPLASEAVDEITISPSVCVTNEKLLQTTTRQIPARCGWSPVSGQLVLFLSQDGATLAVHSSEKNTQCAVLTVRIPLCVVTQHGLAFGRANIQ